MSIFTLIFIMSHTFVQELETKEQQAAREASFNAAMKSYREKVCLGIAASDTMYFEAFDTM